MIELSNHHVNQKRIIVTALITLVFAAVIKLGTSYAFAADTAKTSNEKIITIHDGVTERGIVTTAATLRDALKQANISVESSDITEPGLDEPLVAASYEANIYRSRTVVIKRGALSTRVVTAYRTGKQIATQAGIELADADTATLQASKDLIADGAGEVLSISYAPRVKLTFYGKLVTVATRAVTVADMLKQSGISPAADDTLSVAGTTPITDGLSVQLWKNGKQTVTVEEDLAYTTRQVQDANHDKGYKEIQTAGVSGKKTVTYEINMKNGVEVARTVVNSVVTLPAVEQVELVGVKVNLPSGSHTDWMAAAGIAESDFGYVDYIISKESNWNYMATNSSSGAYGLCQALPGNKMATSGSDYSTNPITQLKWCNGYAVGRYGGWAGAYNAWQVKHWW